MFISTSIDDNELETKICKVLSMTAGTEITSSMLQSCHRLTKKNVVIVKFNDRKVRQNVITNRRKLKEKSDELGDLGFHEKIYINDSLCKLNKELFYKCRELKKAKKVYDTWFFNNKICLQVSANGPIKNVFHS